MMSAFLAWRVDEAGKVEEVRVGANAVFTSSYWEDGDRFVIVLQQRWNVDRPWV